MQQSRVGSDPKTSIGTLKPSLRGFCCLALRMMDAQIVSGSGGLMAFGEAQY